MLDRTYENHTIQYDINIKPHKSKLIFEYENKTCRCLIKCPYNNDEELQHLNELWKMLDDGDERIGRIIYPSEIEVIMILYGFLNIKQAKNFVFDVLYKYEDLINMFDID